MKNEDRIVELLATQLIRQDQLIEEVRGLKVEIIGVKKEVFGVKGEVTSMKVEVAGVKEEISGVKDQLNRHQRILEHIVEALTDDVPKYDEVLDAEYLKEGK